MSFVPKKNCGQRSAKVNSNTSTQHEKARVDMYFSILLLVFAASAEAHRVFLLRVHFVTLIFMQYSRVSANQAA